MGGDEPTGACAEENPTEVRVQLGHSAAGCLFCFVSCDRNRLAAQVSLSRCPRGSFSTGGSGDGGPGV